MIDILSENHGDVYFEMMASLINEGYDNQTAIFECWNKLEANASTGN